MDIPQLQEEQAKIAARFDEVTKQREEVEAELHRLQGDYRTIGKLIKDLEPTDVPADAGTIDVEPTLREEDKKHGKRTK